MEGMFKKVRPQQGRSPFEARSVLSVRERERREERLVCEPEGWQNGDLPTRSRFGRHGTAGLSAVALAKAGGFFEHSLCIIGNRTYRRSTAVSSHVGMGNKPLGKSLLPL